MRKLINSTYVSLDGVVTDQQEWTFSFRDDGADQFAFDQLMACDALLMGRRTYELFSAVWPTRTDAGGMADKMNSMPKYVASRTLKEATWNATVIQDGLAEEVDRLKRRPAKTSSSMGMKLADMKCYDSGLLILTYQPVSR